MQQNHRTDAVRLQADPDRAAIAGPAGVTTVLHAPLGNDSFGTFLQDQAAAASVDLRKISLQAPAAGNTAPGTGVSVHATGPRHA